MALLRHRLSHRSSQRGSLNLIDVYHLSIEEPNPVLVPYLEQAGFSTIATLGFCKVDKALVTAIVERWRDETHTFHLPTGECTITLEDVALQLGLPVNGRPVTGPSMFNWNDVCEELLGEAPPANQMVGQCVKIKWLKDRFAIIPQDPTEEQLQFHCRAYILRLIGGVLMPDKSGNRVHLMYLPKLRDLQSVGRYSWGSACLATLYREMCRATKPSYNCMGGCMLLLQSWVWYRMPFIPPQCNHTPSFPLGKRWSLGGMSYIGTPRGDITGYRSRIDHMESHQFLWMPYRDLLSYLPEAAFRGSEIWTANTALICFQNVEWHQTDRVKLQFGLLQEIPNEPVNMDAQHSVDMRGNQSENWKDIHAEWIQLWKERRRRVLTGQPIHGHVLPTNEYMVWLRSNSNLYLSIQPQLRDPRCGVQEESDVGPSMPPQPTQRRAQHSRRHIPSTPAPIEDEDQEGPRNSFSFTPIDPEPPRHSFAFTPTQQDAPQHYDAHRHSIASSNDDFVSNLFGVTMGTPASVQYMGNLYSFGVPAFPNLADASSSQNPTNVDLNEALYQEEQPTIVEEEQPTEPPRRRNPARNRKPPRCGTGHHFRE